MKHLSPAQLSSRVIRINLTSYFLLKELSRKRNLTMAEAFDMVITKLAPEPVVEPVVVTPEIQLSIMPITTARSIPVIASTQVRSTPVKVSFSREVESAIRYRQTNGH